MVTERENSLTCCIPNPEIYQKDNSSYGQQNKGNHHRWNDVITQVHELMESETLDNLAQDVIERNYLPGLKTNHPIVTKS